MRRVIVTSIVGARPQFIKAAAVSRAIAGHNEKPPDSEIVHSIIHTGQHYDESMSRAFFKELEIPQPDYNLGVGSAPHGAQTGQMLERIETTLVNKKPDLILVYGDTNSTLAGALAATKLHIPVAHVEAGLRSFNRKMPEEVNRVLTDHISMLLFCPTATAVSNLLAEGITQGVHLVGDVMYDCIQYYRERAKAVASSVLTHFGVTSSSYFLATIHRAENTDDTRRLRNIFTAFAAISCDDCPVLIPLHPRTRKRFAEIGLTSSNGTHILESVSYLEMLALESNARVILTDSGGVQKEAYWLRVPCVTLRNETEWPETVQSGWNRLAGAEQEEIVEIVRSFQTGPLLERPLCNSRQAAQKICEIISAGMQRDRQRVLSDCYTHENATLSQA